MIQILSVGHTKFNGFQQNIKQDNYIEYTIEVISCNSDDSHYSSSIINVRYYHAEIYEEEFISAAGDFGLPFSDQISVVESTSMIFDIGHKIDQLRIRLKVLRDKLSAKMLEP